MNEQNQKENRAEKLTDFGFSKVKEADKEKQVKAVFDQVAPKYDLMNDVLSEERRVWICFLLFCLGKMVNFAPVAHLDRVLPSEGRGSGFDSRRVRHPPDHL